MGYLGKGLLIVCAAIALAPAAASADGPPQIGPSWVESESVTPTGAALSVELSPNGFNTSHHFEYISDAAYRANLEAIPPRDPFAGAALTTTGNIGATAPPKSVSRGVSGLKPATSYHYRPLATNIEGTEIGVEHVFTTEETGVVFRLPDNRGWEMVSPVDKNGGDVATPEAIFGGGDIQASATAPAEGGPFLTYGSATSFGQTAGAPPASQYSSRRTAAGWLTANVSTPLDSAAYGADPDGAPHRLFSTDLSRALLFGGLACREGLAGCPAPNEPLPGTGAPPGYMAYYLRDNASGSLSSLLRPADVAHSSVSPQNFEVEFAAASSDLSHVVLSSCAALSADATEIPAGPGACDPAAPNLYEWSSSGLKSLNGSIPGAEIAAPGGAVSSDGTRIYWTRGGNLFLSDGAQSFRVDEGQGGGGGFQTASADGSLAFFTKAGHLYRFAAATKAATDIAPASGVIGVLGASSDGAHVYFQDGAGLEHWHEGTTVTVAPGAAAAPSDYPPATGTSRISADGTRLAFLSTASLTGYDNTNATTGLPDAEVYLYGPPLAGGPAELNCASCNPTGGRPAGPSSIPGAAANGTTHAYKPRALSADGTRVFFDTADGIGEKDSNKRADVYEWELAGAGDCHRSPGCLGPISSGNGRDGAIFIDATADGSDVFFVTDESLVGADPKGSADAYDARVNGGFSESSPIIECFGDNCQPLPGEPDDPTPGTLVQNPGNPALRIFSPKKKSKPRLKRHKHPGHRHGAGGKHRRGGGSGGSGR